MNAIPGKLVTLSTVLLLSACSFNTDKILPDKQVEYKREKQSGSYLEVPPDLTANTIDNQSVGLTTPGKGSTTFSEYHQEGGKGASSLRQRAAVLPPIEGVSMQREGDIRWLLINGPADSVWPKVIEYWQSNGILLIEQDPAAGVMRTGWIENRADVSTDFVTDFMRGIFDGFYDAGTRDQFRLRIERTPNNQTELFLTHFGMKEVLLQNQSGDDENSYWEHRPRDPELEAIMLRQVMNYLGVAEAQSQAEQAASPGRTDVGTQLIKNANGITLLVEEGFSEAWRLTGLALDRVGFVVEDRDRSRGVYYVRYRDPEAEQPDESWLGKLKFWGDDEKPGDSPRYQIAVEGLGEASFVSVLNNQGVRDNSATAQRLLTLIKEQLK